MDGTALIAPAEENNNLAPAPANEAELPALAGENNDVAPARPAATTLEQNNLPADVEAAPAAAQNDLDNHKINAPVGNDDDEHNYGAAALADEEDAVDALLNMVIVQYCRV
jgi:hypothetical protein